MLLKLCLAPIGAHLHRYCRPLLRFVSHTGKRTISPDHVCSCPNMPPWKLLVIRSSEPAMSSYHSVMEDGLPVSDASWVTNILESHTSQHTGWTSDLPNRVQARAMEESCGQAKRDECSPFCSSDLLWTKGRGAPSPLQTPLQWLEAHQTTTMTHRYDEYCDGPGTMLESPANAVNHHSYVKLPRRVLGITKIFRKLLQLHGCTPSGIV